MKNMYCSSCGEAVKPGLSYCNRWGAELSGKERSATKPFDISPDSLVWAIVVVTVGGLAMLIGLMALMKESNFNLGLIVAFTVLSFLLLLGAASVFIWLLLRSKSGAKETSDTAQLKEPATKELGAAQARALAEPAPRVTEHTTRTLEPIYSERKAK